MRNVFIIISLLFAQQLIYSQGEYEAKIFLTSNNDTLRYRELLPENYQPQQKYPLVLFLHGAGERGSDNQAQLMHGSRMFTNPVHREKYPAIVLFPQCPAGLRWTFANSPLGNTNANAAFTNSSVLQAVKDLLDQTIAKGNIDTDRIYIMGLSMGGFGTYEMVCRYPDVFAAAIPICGRSDPEQLRATAGKVKFRIYHGDRDDTVPVETSRDAYRALKAYGANVEYLEFVGCNHNSWDPAFNQPDFLSWLFSQRK
jgi:predicted peptidase